MVFDTIAWFSQEVRRWFEDDLGSELVASQSRCQLSRCRVNWCGSALQLCSSGGSRHHLTKLSLRDVRIITSAEFRLSLSRASIFSVTVRKLSIHFC